MATANKNIWTPSGSTDLTPLQTPFATLAQSVDDALVAQDGTIPSAAVADVAARLAKYPSPVQGNRVWRNDLGYEETYYSTYNLTTNPGGRSPAGWYQTTGAQGNSTHFTYSQANVDGSAQYPPLTMNVPNSSDINQATYYSSGGFAGVLIARPGIYSIMHSIKLPAVMNGRSFVQIGLDTDFQHVRASFFAGEDQCAVSSIFKVTAPNIQIPIYFLKSNGSLGTNTGNVHVVRLG